MTSRQTSAPSCLRTNYKHGNVATYGVSTQNEEAASRRVCMSGLPRETKIDDIIQFFDQGAIEGITVRYGSGWSTIAFVQFSRPSDFTEALLKNHQPFLGTRTKIRPYKQGEHPSPQSLAKRRLADRNQSESTNMHSASSKPSPPSRNRNRSSERSLREPPPFSHRNRSRSRSPDTARSPTGPRISERSSSYRPAKSPSSRRRSRSRSPSVRGHTRARTPERSSHSERPKRYDRNKRSPDRARSRSTSADRERHRRNRERSPSLDRNFGRRPDPFLPNDMPNPSEELLVRQSIALWKQQPQAASRIPMAHVFGANSAPLPNLPGTGMARAIAYTTQASQSSYVAQSSGGGGGLFNGHLEKIFAEQAQNRAQQLQATSSGIDGGTNLAGPAAAAAPEMPAGVELILKLILEQKSARHLSMFQLDSVVNYLQEQKRIIQQADGGSDQNLAMIATETPSSVTVDTAGDALNVGPSDDLRNRLNQQNNESLIALALARKIQKYHGSGNIKEEKE